MRIAVIDVGTNSTRLLHRGRRATARSPPRSTAGRPSPASARASTTAACSPTRRWRASRRRSRSTARSSTTTTSTPSPASSPPPSATRATAPSSPPASTTPTTSTPARSPATRRRASPTSAPPPTARPSRRAHASSSTSAAARPSWSSATAPTSTSTSPPRPASSARPSASSRPTRRAPRSSSSSSRRPTRSSPPRSRHRSAPRVTKGIAVAGTATSCAAILQELDPYDPAKVHGFRLLRAQAEMLLARLAQLTTEERRHVTGLHPDRAEAIVAGVILLIEAMRTFDLSEVEVSEHDILRGAALDRAAATAVVMLLPRARVACSHDMSRRDGRGLRNTPAPAASATWVEQGRSPTSRYCRGGVVPRIPTSRNLPGRVSDCRPSGPVRYCLLSGNGMYVPNRLVRSPSRRIGPSEAASNRRLPPLGPPQSGPRMARTPARPVGAEFGSRPFGRLPTFWV